MACHSLRCSWGRLLLESISGMRGIGAPQIERVADWFIYDHCGVSWGLKWHFLGAFFQITELSGRLLVPLMGAYGTDHGLCLNRVRGVKKQDALGVSNLVQG